MLTTAGGKRRASVWAASSFEHVLMRSRKFYRTEETLEETLDILKRTYSGRPEEDVQLTS